MRRFRSVGNTVFRTLTKLLKRLDSGAIRLLFQRLVPLCSACERTVGTCLVGLALLLLADGARADEPPTYEAQRVDHALRANGYERDPVPYGKRISFIRIVREEVFIGEELLVPIVLPREAPTWPNAFHWLTEESVVRRELLVQEGELYDAERIAESERNLRSLGILALARIEAVRGASAEEVGLLVFTRDLWSLRLETGFEGAGAAYGVTAQLVERNLFGRNKQLALRVDSDSTAWSVGEVYADSRVAGERLSLNESFDLIFNHQTGETEGSQGALSFGKPFYDLQQQLSWTVSASYSVAVIRDFFGTELRAVRPVDGELVPCAIGTPRCYQRTWDQQRGGGSASASYRIGTLYKQTFTLELAFSDTAVQPNDQTLVESGTVEEAVDEVLPRVRRQGYPRLGYSLWLPRYAVLENLSTFGQSESVRVGPELTASFAVPIEAFGSSTDSLVFSASAGYVWSRWNALWEAKVGGATRLEEGRPGDQKLTLMARGATPSWLLGRLVGIVSFVGQRRDTDGTVVTLGGDNGLRGYESGAFFADGGSSIRGSAEYRTLPLELSSVHIGGVLFYDVGGVYTSVSHIDAGQSVGTGLRFLFPQFNRYPFRVDVGFPLSGGFSAGLSYGSDPAIALTATDEAIGRVSVRPQ